MVFDTASIPGRFGFKPDARPTFKNIKGASWLIVVGDGSYARSTVGTDVVKVSGGHTVTNQAVKLAVEVTSGFDKGPRFTGVVGLAFSSIKQVRPKAQNTFDNAKANLTSPLFAAYLPFQADGSYDFGILNTSHYTGFISYSPISPPNMFWKVPSSSFKVGDNTYPLLDSTTTIIDTSSSLAMMPDSACTAYYSQVPGATHVVGSDGWYFPCSATLPDLPVAIEDSFAKIPGNLINFSHDDSNTTCFGGLQCFGCPAVKACARQVNVFGDVFLNANHAVFDSQGPRFGFAPLVTPPPVAPVGPEPGCSLTATCG